METKFYRVRSVKDLTISVALLLTGCTIVLIPTPVSINIIGLCLIVAGFILILALKTGWKTEGKSEVFKCKTLFFSKEEYGAIKDALETKPEALAEIRQNTSTQLKLDIFWNPRVDKAYCQLMEYIPYEYQYCCPMQEVNLATIKKVL